MLCFVSCLDYASQIMHVFVWFLTLSHTLHCIFPVYRKGIRRIHFTSIRRPVLCFEIHTWWQCFFFQNAICGIIILLQRISLPFPSFAPSHITSPTLLQIHDLCFHDNSVLLKSMLSLRRAESSIHIYQCFRQRLRRKVVFPFSTGLLK